MPRPTYEQLLEEIERLRGSIDNASDEVERLLDLVEGIARGRSDDPVRAARDYLFERYPDGFGSDFLIGPTPLRPVSEWLVGMAKGSFPGQ